MPNLIEGAMGLLLLLPSSSAAVNATEWHETLWREGAKVVQTVPCSKVIDGANGHCLSIQAVNGKAVSTIGGGYIGVKVLWSKRTRRAGPDAVVLGDYGGSGGNSDLLAIRFSPKLKVRKISGDRTDMVAADAHKADFAFALPFTISSFNNAPHAADTTVFLPMVWRDNDFALDIKALGSRTFSEEDIHFRELAVRYELNRWAQDSYPATDLYPIKTTEGTPVTAQALSELILSGHGDIARAILHKTWPSSFGRSDVPMGGEPHFWALLCRAIVRNDNWRRFGLARLPHAADIETAAREIS